MPTFSSSLSSSAIPEPDVSAGTQLGQCYHDAKTEVLRHFADKDNLRHRQILKALLAEAEPCIPFPNDILHGKSGYCIAPETIDVAPHKFELAKFIKKLNWITRLALIKEGGSATEKTELFASRTHTHSSILFSRWVEPDNWGLSAAVLQTGSCGDSCEFAAAIAKSLDDEMLRDMGIHLDLSKVTLYKMGDYTCKHAYLVAHYDDDMPLSPEKDNHASLDQEKLKFPDDTDKTRLWGIDPHQSYPMTARYDKSTHNHLVHTNILWQARLGNSGTSSGLNLEFAKQIRQGMISRLQLGEDGIKTALQSDDQKRHKIRSRFVEQTMRTQGVSHYAEVDRSRLNQTEQAKFDRKVQWIKQETARKNVKSAYKCGNMEETWVGLCLPENPDVAYRNSETGEILTTTVSPHYFERTERIRWAHDVWKALRPDRSVLDSRLRSFFTRFDIPAAVEAIERLPFLSALAGARAMHLGNNTVHLHTLGQFEQALASMESWVEKMHQDLSPQLVTKIHTIGLKEEVNNALLRVQENFRVFSERMEKFKTDVAALSPPPDEQQQARIDALCSRALSSSALQQIPTLLKAFKMK